MRYHYTPTKLAKIRTLTAHGCGGLKFAPGNASREATLEGSWQFLINKTPYDPAILLLEKQNLMSMGKPVHECS